MRYFHLAALSCLLPLASAVGWWGDARVALGCFLLGVFVLVLWKAYIRRSPVAAPARYLLIALYGGFLSVAGFGVIQGPRPTKVLVTGAMLIILVAYGARLMGLMARARKNQRFDEGFLSSDIWHLNIGVMSFAAVVVLQIMRHGTDATSIARAIWMGSIPLSLPLLFCLLTRAARRPFSAAWLWYSLAASCLLFTAAGAARGVMSYSEILYARRCASYDLGEESEAALRRAREHNQWLRLAWLEREIQRSPHLEKHEEY
jgi:hypothetical protein